MQPRINHAALNTSPIAHNNLFRLSLSLAVTMLISPHATCAKVLDTVKYSGLTYTLNETPYSVYLTVRKKYTKEYSPSQHTSEHNKVDCKDTLAQLLKEEIANHNLTRQELALKDEQLGRSVEANNQNISTSTKSIKSLNLLMILPKKLMNTSKQNMPSEDWKKKWKILKINSRRKVWTCKLKWK